MDMGYDFEDPRNGAGTGLRIGRFAAPPGLHRDEAAPLRPDWAALRSRFEAIHALRRTLASGAAPHLPAGGFADSGGAVLTSCREEVSSVNLVYSANGKAVWANINPVAAPPPSGDRGIQ